MNPGNAPKPPSGPPSEQAGTPRSLIDWAESRFRAADLYYGHGTDNPRDEAVYLVLRALDLPLDPDPGTLDAPRTGDERRRLAALVERRIQERVPVAYLVNEAWFCGLPFYVDERVHIPRSPIAELIEDGFSPWLPATGPGTILDLCTGSGSIAVACALAFPAARVDAADSSRDALAVAARNVERYGLGHQVRLMESDLYARLGRRRYDLIVSNPPYVGSGEMENLPAEYLHEPAASLHAGADGLDIIRRLLHGARRHLQPDGVLVVEAGNSEEAVAESFPGLPFTWLEFERGGQGVFLLTADQL